MTGFHNLARALAALILGALLSAQAPAAPVHVTWINPTQRTDGTALPATELRGTLVQRGTCNGALFGTLQGSQIIAAGGTLAIHDLVPGPHCFRVFARAVNLSNPSAFVQSSASAVVPYTVPGVVPPPSYATIERFVYDVRLSSSGVMRIGHVVGNAPLGTPCTTDVTLVVSGSTLYRVASQYVTFARAPRSTVLLAKCAVST